MSRIRSSRAASAITRSLNRTRSGIGFDGGGLQVAIPPEVAGSGAWEPNLVAFLQTPAIGRQAAPAIFRKINTDKKASAHGFLYGGRA